MSWARKAQVIAVLRDRDSLPTCGLEQLLSRSGSALDRLILVTAIEEGAEELREALGGVLGSSRIQLIAVSASVTDAEAFGRGLEQRRGDVALLGVGIDVCAGWLQELADVAHSEERVFCSSAVVDPIGRTEAGYRGSAPGSGQADIGSAAACERLPRSTSIPAPEGVCCYIRGDLIDAVGPWNKARGSVDDALIEWTMKAQTLGFFAKRANRVVACQRSRPLRHTAHENGRAGAHETLHGQHPFLAAQLQRFHRTVDGALASRALACTKSGRIRVAYDLRSLPREHVGTRTYAVSLGKELGAVPGIDLTLLVLDPAQAEGLCGRVVTPETWQDDVDIIHRPMQIRREELQLLYESSAHVIVTYQDLIAYRIPEVFPSEAEFANYGTTSALGLQAAQRILAYSETTATEIVDEFGIPRNDISVIALGVDRDWFARRSLEDSASVHNLNLPASFFLSVATDYPHKNLARLLEAYQLMRSTWVGHDCPGLVLVGHAMSAQSGRAHTLRGSENDGVRYVGPVSAEQLRVLYQRAKALVFPSLYEGFGLPPLEAMAAGTPVIAMRISSIPDVVGDCALYPDGLSAAALAHAMERVAVDPGLQERLQRMGAGKVAEYSWSETARKTVETYQTTILEPSQRSLALRRQLREAIRNWSAHAIHAPILQASTIPDTSRRSTLPDPDHQELPGIRSAWRDLSGAVHRRIRREAKRILSIPPWHVSTTRTHERTR